MSDFPDEKTLQVLVKLALQEGEDFYIYEKIGESIGFVVIAELGTEYIGKLSFLLEIVKAEAIAVIKNEIPEWGPASRYFRDAHKSIHVYAHENYATTLSSGHPAAESATIIVWTLPFTKRLLKSQNEQC